MRKFYSVLSRMSMAVFFALSCVVPAGAQATQGQSMVFGYCQTLAGGLSLRQAAYCGAAMGLSDLIRERFDGCRITAVQIANGQFMQETSDISIFFSESLDKAPFRTIAAEMDRNKYLTFKEYILDEPVDISVDSPLFVGFTAWDAATVVGNKQNAIVTLDGIAAAEPGGYMGVGQKANPETMQWQDLSEIYGMAAIKLRIEGDNLPVDLVELSSLTVTDYVAPNQSVKASISLKNCGINSVKSVELTYELDNGEQTVEKSFPLAITTDKKSSTSITIPCNTIGNNLPVKVRVTKVNDREPGKGAVMGRVGYLLCMPSTDGYKRNMLIEEVTSLSCGWCPRGIVGVANMLELHPDGSFIPVCISSYSDPATYPMALNYGPIWNITSSMPSCLINRNLVRFGICDPSETSLRQYYNTLKNIPGMAKIELTGMEVDGKTATLKSAVTFALDEEGSDYRIAYVVTENNVGPNDQLNFYAGGASGNMGGWEKKGQYVETYHNHFARAISEFNGEEGSIPADVTAGTVYEHSGTIDLSQVTNMANIEVIAMVVNNITGAVENAVTATPEAIAGIEGIEADAVAGGVAEYFDLQGRRIASPAAGGIYIRRQGDKTEKIAVKAAL